MTKSLLTNLFSLAVVLLFLPFSTTAQPDFTANDRLTPYTGGFRLGVNFDIYRGFTDEDMANLAAGNAQLGASGVGAKAVRPGLFEDFTETYGYDTRLSTFRFYDSLGLKDNTLIIGFPTDAHRDDTYYCSAHRSTVFKNLNAPIWDGGANGTPVNDSNYYALYVWKLATRYKNYVKFWEVWNEPGFDYTGGLGWRPRGTPNNWWDNNPNPCDYKLRAPIQTYVRMLRISYEIIKTVDPNAYVVTSGLGFPSFLDAVLRNTDNPDNGRVSPQYPHGGGAYFDGIGYHAYPHFDDALRSWNGTGWDYQRHSDPAGNDMGRVKELFDAVLRDYGYNGQRFPKKQYLITEANLPRKEFGEFIGSAESQRNWLPKAVASCLKNNIHQLHIFKIAEETAFDKATYEFDLMGLYEKLHYSNKLKPDLTDLGVSYRSTSQILFGNVYDSVRTRQMNLPSNVDGIALRDTNGVFTYMLWAKTTTDKSEFSSATYSFPTSWNYTDLIRRDWAFSKSKIQMPIAAQNIVLSAAPIFLTEQKIKIIKQYACVGESIYLEDLTPSVNQTWTVRKDGLTFASLAGRSISLNGFGVGNYVVTLRTTDANGLQTALIQTIIFIETPPSVNFDKTVQTPLVILKNRSSANADSLRWTFSDGTNSHLPDLTKGFYQNGTFNITLTAENRCGARSTTQNVTITNAPISTPSRTALQTTPPYNEPFRAGANFRFVEGWQDEDIADIAAGNRAKQLDGVAARSIRTQLPAYFTKFWGTDIRKRTFQHFGNLDLRDMTLTIGFPDSTQRDPNFYCYNQQSSLFKNMYMDIWKADGSVNDSNYMARYVMDLVKMYKNQVKFWEVWDTPGWDLEGKNGWKSPRPLLNSLHNWWENNPDPCELGVHAPAQHIVRMMRIVYEVVKKEDSTAFVTFSGAGFPAFLDVILRNSDNPTDGSKTAQFPHGGGAYFDAVLYNVFPHFDGSLAYFDSRTQSRVFRRNSDAAAQSIVYQRDTLQSVLKNYGFDGSRLPKKQFIIGEINVPRKPLGEYQFGSDEVQRNFILKSYVLAAKASILQMNVKSISEESDYATATDPSQVMGLYQKLQKNAPPNRSINIQGIAFKTTSELLFGTKYDSIRTDALNLPPSVNGAAFRAANGKYTYVVWSKATQDLAEWGSSNYSFPNALGINNLYQRNWTYTQDKRTVRVSPLNLELMTTPIFLLEDTAMTQPPMADFSSNMRQLCPPLTVRFVDSSAYPTSYLWRFDGGNPTISTERTPSVTYARSGKYDVVLEVRNQFGRHSHRKIEYVIVDSIPKAQFNYRIDTANLTVSFTNTSTSSFSMIWDFGDGSQQDFRVTPPPHRFPRRDTFRVRLIAFNDCGRDTFFTTINLKTTGINDLQNIDFQLFPNPFSSELTVNLSLKEPTHLTFKLFEATGRLVENLAEKAVYTEGGHSLIFRPKNLAVGVYFLQIQSDKNVAYRQLVKM